MKEKLQLQLKRVVSGAIAVGVMVTSAVPAYASTMNGISSMQYTGDSSGVVAEQDLKVLPETPSAISNQYQNMLNSVSVTPTAVSGNSQVESEDPEDDGIATQSDESVAVQSDEGIAPLADWTEAMLGGGTATVPPTPTITPPSGSVGAQIVQHKYTTTISDMTNTGRTQLVIGIVDNRAVDKRDVVTVVVKDNYDAVLGTTTASWSSETADGNVYYAYMTVLNGLMVGVNELTVTVSTPTGNAQQYTNTYTIDTRDISNFKVNNADILYDRFGSADGDVLGFTINYSLNTRSLNEYTVNVYCDDQLFQSTRVRATMPRTDDLVLKQDRDASIQSGTHSFRIEVNEDRSIYENNYADNSFSKTIEIGKDRQPNLSSSTANNTLQGSAGSDVYYNVRINNNGSDAVEAPVNFVVNGKTIYTVDVTVPGEGIFNQNVTIPFDMVKEYVTEYKVGSKYPNGQVASVNSYGANITCRLGDGTGEYIDSPTRKTQLTSSIDRFFYWYSESDVAIELEQTTTAITAATTNMFKVTLTNNNPAVAATVHFSMSTTGSTTVIVYNSDAITIPAGGKVERYVTVYCPDAVGVNFVEASIVETDADNTNNRKSLSYSVGLDAGYITVTGFATTEDTSVAAGTVIPYTSKWTISTFDQEGSVNKQPKSFPGSKLMWYVDGKLIATDTVTVLANTQMSFTRNIDTTTLTPGEHSCYTVLDTGYTSDGKSVGGTSKSEVFRVLSGVSISVKDLQLTKSTYANTEKIGYSFTVVNLTNKDISDMRVKVSIPGTTYVKETKIFVGRMAEQDVSNTLSCNGTANGVSYSLMGNHTLRVEVNLDDDGVTIYGDDTPKDNYMSADFTVTDSFPFDVALENVKLVNPQTAYSGQSMPEFTMSVRNYSSKAVPVVVAAKAGSTVLYQTTLRLPAAALSGGVISPAGYDLTENLNITSNGTYSVVWSVTVQDAALAVTESNKANNSSSAFSIKVDTFKDLSVSGMRAEPSSVYEDQAMDLYYTIHNTGNETVSNVGLLFLMGLPPESLMTDNLSDQGAYTIKETFKPYFNKELHVQLQYYVPPTETAATTAFVNFGENVPVTLKFVNPDTGQLWSSPLNAVTTNDSSTIYVNNYPRADNLWVTPGTSCSSTAHLQMRSDGTAYTAAGLPLVYVDLQLKSEYPSRVLNWPDARVTIKFEGHEDWYSPVIATKYEGAITTAVIDTTTSENPWGTYDGTFPFVYDGLEQDVTIVCTVDCGLGVPGAWPEGNKIEDPDWSNNVVKFKVHLPEFPRMQDYVSKLSTSAFVGGWTYGNDMAISAAWYNRSGKQDEQFKAKRELWVNDVKVWESNESWTNDPARYDTYTFTTKELEDKGVDLSGDSLKIESRINPDKAFKEQVKETDEYYNKEYTNNNAQFVVPIKHLKQIDFATTELSTTSELRVEPGTYVPVKVVFENLSSEDVIDSIGNAVDVRFVLKLNDVEIVSQTIPKMGEIFVPLTFDVDVPIQYGATGPQVLEATINPSRTIEELDYSNNSKYITFMCEDVGEKLDMSVTANPANYTAMVDDPPKTISFKASMTKNVSDPFTRYNTQADLYVDDMFAKRINVVWDATGSAGIEYTVPANLMKSAGYHVYELRINPDEVWEETNYENNVAFAGLLIKEPDVPDDYTVKNVKVTYDDDHSLKIQGTFSNAGSSDTPELLCEWEVYNPTTKTWQSIWSSPQDVKSGNGVTYNQTIGISPDWIDPEGKIKIRAKINNDRKYDEPDFSNNIVEVTVTVDNRKDVSAEWIKAVPKSEYDRFSEIVKTGGNFTSVDKVMPDDVVYLVACFKNNNKFSTAGPCDYTVKAVTTTGKTGNNLNTGNTIASIGINDVTYVNASYKVSDEDTLKLEATISMTGDAVPGNNTATGNLPVVMTHVKNLTADSISFVNNTTSSTKTISSGDSVTIKVKYHNDMFDFDAHEWAVYAQDTKGHKWLVTDYTSVGSTALRHNESKELTLKVPEWNIYQLDSNASLVFTLDPSNKIEETVETDNSCSVPFTYYNRFNITVGIGKYKQSIDQGQKIEIPITLDFTGMTDNVKVKVNMYLDGKLVETQEKWAMTTGTIYFTKVMDDKGDHTFRVEVNPASDRTVYESAYNDNEASTSFYVSGDPNIRIPETTIISAVSGGTINLGSQVQTEMLTVSETAINNFTHVVYRYRMQSVNETDPRWIYQWASSDDLVKEIVGLTVKDTVKAGRLDFYGDNIFVVEINPVIPASEVAALKNEASAAGVTLNITGGKRQYEEVNYDDNTCVGKFHIQEYPDYIGGWTFLMQQSDSTLTDLMVMDIDKDYESGVQLKQDGPYWLQCNMGIVHETMGIFSRYTDIPYTVVHTLPSGSKETVFNSTYEYGYKNITWTGAGYAMAQDWANAMVKVDTSNPGWHTYTITVNAGNKKSELSAYKSNNVRTFRYYVQGDAVTVNLKATKLELLTPADASQKPVFRVTIQQTGSTKAYLPNPSDKWATNPDLDIKGLQIGLLNLNKTTTNMWTGTIDSKVTDKSEIRGMWFTYSGLSGVPNSNSFTVDLSLPEFESTANKNYQNFWVGVKGKTSDYSSWYNDEYPVGGGLVHYAVIINPRWNGVSATGGLDFEGGRRIKETTYEDNIAYLDVNWAADSIDLVAKSVTITGEPESAGEVEVVSVIQNTAKRVTVQEVEVQYFLDGKLWHTEKVTLPMGESTTVTFTDKLPRCEGNVKLEMKVNTNSACVETNYNNNSASKTFNVLGPQLDLVAVSIVPDGTLKRRNDPVTFTIEVTNSKTGVAKPHTVEDVNVVLWDIEGNQLYRTLISEIAAGETVTSTIKVFVPDNAAYGTMKWIMEVNPESIGSSDFKDELRFDNNTTSCDITVDPPKNFIVTGGELEKDVIPEGDPTVVNIKITSIDPTKPYTPEVVIKVDGVVVSKEPVDIPAGGEIVYRKEIPDVPLGDHTIEVIVNPDHTLPEDDYEDNEWHGSVTVLQGKDLAVTLNIDNTIVARDKNFTVTARFTNNGNKLCTNAPYYVSYKGVVVKSGTITLAAKEVKDVLVTIPAGSILGFHDLEAGINTVKMLEEEYDTSNNITYLTVRVRDHNTGGSINGTPLDPEDPVVIEKDPSDPKIDEIVKTDDPTSIIDKIIIQYPPDPDDPDNPPDPIEVDPDDPEFPFDHPIGPGQEINITITITTDDREKTTDYEVIVRRPSDDVDADAYIVAGGIKYPAVRGEDDVFVITLPATASGGVLTLEATEKDSYISEVDGEPTRDDVVTISDLGKLYADREMTVYFTGKSPSGLKSKDFVVKITIANTPPTITITNAFELDGAVFNTTYGKVLDGTKYPYGPGITGVAEAILANKTHGIVVEVLGKDTDPEQFVYAKVTFQDKEYPVYWEDYSGPRTTESGSDVRGFAYIPSADLTGTSVNNPLKAYIYDNLVSSTDSYLSVGESDPVEIDIDNMGPSGDITYDPDDKTITIENIHDNNVGQYQVVIRAKSSKVSSWGTAKTEDVSLIDKVVFQYPGLSGKIDVEITITDHLGNKTVISDVIEFTSDGSSIDMEGVYSKNSRKATSLFINVRYRGAEKVDLLGFGFIGS